MENGEKNMTSIHVLLADDHHVVRQGLRALLETVADLSIVGQTLGEPVRGIVLAGVMAQLLAQRSVGSHRRSFPQWVSKCLQG